MKHLFVLLSRSGFLLTLAGQVPTLEPVPTPPPASCEAVWYADEDDDGFGQVGRSVVACRAPSGFAALPGDCDDGRADVNPAAREACNDRDDDCDGRPDDAVPLWFRDGDDDGWGDGANTWSRCDRPQGYSPRAGDCDDRDGRRFPGAGC